VLSCHEVEAARQRLWDWIRDAANGGSHMGIDAWMRPTIILGTAFILITLNVLEFRGKRRQDHENTLLKIKPEPNEFFAGKQYALTQNIEQLLHMIATILFAILVALLWK
jgi:hypothetical protein